MKLCFLFISDPANVRMRANRDHYADAIKGGQRSTDPTIKPVKDEYRASEDFLNYERLCRGEKIFKVSNLFISLISHH